MRLSTAIGVALFPSSSLSIGNQGIRGAPFAEPLECTGLSCTLLLGSVMYDGPDTSFTTRGYNDDILGEKRQQGQHHFLGSYSGVVHANTFPP